MEAANFWCSQDAGPKAPSRGIEPEEPVLEYWNRYRYVVERQNLRVEMHDEPVQYMGD
jgi:hypothetical protein